MSKPFNDRSHPDVGSEPNWYVFYTAPRAEKVVQKELSNRGYEVFLPLTKTLRFWNNRQKKIVEQVLFPSYIFVNTEESSLHKICQIPKVVMFINCGGKPSKINYKCIEGIKSMLNLDQEVFIEPGFSEGENVRIISGPLAGHEGVLLKQHSRTRFGIQLKEIKQMISIDVSWSLVQRCSSWYYLFFLPCIENVIATLH